MVLALKSDIIHTWEPAVSCRACTKLWDWIPVKHKFMINTQVFHWTLCFRQTKAKVLYKFMTWWTLKWTDLNLDLVSIKAHQMKCFLKRPGMVNPIKKKISILKNEWLNKKDGFQLQTNMIWLSTGLKNSVQTAGSWRNPDTRYQKKLWITS